MVILEQVFPDSFEIFQGYSKTISKFFTDKQDKDFISGEFTPATFFPAFGKYAFFIPAVQLPVG